MANGKVLKGPYWTRNWIEAMWRFTNENFVDFDTGAVDYEALGKEEFQFRKALFFRNFKNSERAKMAFASAEDDYKNPVENGKKGGRPKKSPQDAPNGNAGVDMYDAGNGAASKSPTSCDQFTADGDIREDSQARHDGSAITRNETRAHDALGPSANQFTADASTREGEDERDHRGNTGTLESSTSANNYGDAATREGADVSTTVSRNMRRVPQNEAPAHGFSGGRTAQGTMSRSPEAAAQSGKAYDQETAKTRDTRDDSRGRYAPPSCSPEDGNPAETAPSHGGSVASLEARQGQALESRRTGGSSVRGMAKVAQPSVRSRAKNSRCPNSREEFHAFVADNKLHEGLAEEWYAMHEARGWVDRDGKPIKEWKGALYNYCTKTEQRRRTA